MRGLSQICSLWRRRTASIDRRSLPQGAGKTQSRPLDRADAGSAGAHLVRVSRCQVLTEIAYDLGILVAATCALGVAIWSLAG